MELLPTDAPHAEPGAQVFRRGAWGDGLMALVFGGFALGATGALIVGWHEIPTPLLPFGIPVALVAVPLSALVAQILAGSFVASFAPSNWLGRVGLHGVRLNLRSFRNAHFEPAAATQVAVAFSEIASVSRVVETYTKPSADGSRTRVRHVTIELTLAGVDTAPLDAAVRAEAQREAPNRSFMGVRSSTAHRELPVYCEAPGVVRVVWHRRLYRALAQRVPAPGERKVDADRIGADADLATRVAALVRRGERIAALHLLRAEAGLDLAAAKDWLAAQARGEAPPLQASPRL